MAPALPRARRIALARAALALAAVASATHAQPTRRPAAAAPSASQPPVDVGHVDDVKGLGQLQGCDSSFVAPGTSGLWIRRGPSSGPVSAERGETVRTADALLVNATTDVRLRVESADLGRGTLYLAPSLLCNAKVRRDTVVGRLGRAARGAGYALAVDVPVPPATRPGAARPVSAAQPTARRLELAVDSGALIVQWHGGPDHPLIVRAAGHRIPVLGTELAVHADRTGNEALLYLQEGTVSFEGFPGIVVRPGELYWLRRGLPPVLLSGAALLRPAMTRHARSVWQRFWQKPSFWAWSGLAAGAAAACVAACPFGSDTPADVGGTVIIRIPF